MELTVQLEEEPEAMNRLLISASKPFKIWPLAWAYLPEPPLVVKLQPLGFLSSLEYTKCFPTPGPLHTLFSLSGQHLPWIFKWLFPSPLSDLIENIASSKGLL